MTSSAQLIDRLVGDLTPAPRAWIARRLAMGFGCGALVSIGLTLSLRGMRPDIGAALSTWPFWAKFGFTGLLTSAGIDAVRRLARPGLGAPRAIRAAVLTDAAMSIIALAQLGFAPEGVRRTLVLGATAATCPWLIIGLSLPIFAGGCWAVRAMAPTRLPIAGMAVGFASGAAAAAIYASSCDEIGMPFTAIWYSLGIGASTMIGGLLGPRLLRW